MPRLAISEASRFQEPVLHICPVLLLELFPFLRLGGVNEVQNHVGIKAESAVVVFGSAFAIAALFGQEMLLDSRLKVFLGNVHHPASSLTSILPVTAAEIRAMRYRAGGQWLRELWRLGHRYSINAPRLPQQFVFVLEPVAERFVLPLRCPY